MQKTVAIGLCLASLLAAATARAAGRAARADGVVECATCAACEGAANIAIPSSATAIGYEAFQGCTSLATVTIPDSATAIGVDAFPSCLGFGLTVPGAPKAGVVRCIPCAGVTNLAIPPNVTAIGKRHYDRAAHSGTAQHSLGAMGSTALQLPYAGGSLYLSDFAIVLASPSFVVSPHGGGIQSLPAGVCWLVRAAVRHVLPGNIRMNER